MPKQRINFRDEGLVIMSWGRFVVCDLGEPLNVPRMHAIRKSVVDASSEGTVGLMGAFDLSRFDIRRAGTPAVREELHKLATIEGKHLFGCGCSLEGKGLVMTTVRSTITAVAVVARPPYPLKVFDSRGQAAAFLVEESRSSGPSPLPNVMEMVEFTREERLALAG